MTEARENDRTEASKLILDIKKKHAPTKGRFYFSTATAILATSLALLLLHNYTEWTLLYLYYFISTLVITIITYIAKIRLSRFRETNLQREGLDKAEERHRPWKELMALFLAVFAFLFVPILLWGILDPKTGFILITSITSGISYTDVILYALSR